MSLALAILTFLQGALRRSSSRSMLARGRRASTFVGRSVSFSKPQWGQAILAGMMAVHLLLRVVRLLDGAGLGLDLRRS